MDDGDGLPSGEFWYIFTHQERSNEFYSKTEYQGHQFYMHCNREITLFGNRLNNLAVQRCQAVE